MIHPEPNDFQEAFTEFSRGGRIGEVLLVEMRDE